MILDVAAYEEALAKRRLELGVVTFQEQAHPRAGSGPQGGQFVKKNGSGPDPKKDKKKKQDAKKAAAAKAAALRDPRMPVRPNLDPKAKLPSKKRSSKLGPMEISASDNALLEAADDPARLQAMINQAKGLGVSNWRLVMEWGQVVHGGQMDLSRYDKVVEALRRNHITVQMAVLGTARYHPQLDQQLSWKNADPNKARWFARQVAAHFNGRVARYSAWNEPNIGDTFLHGGDTAAGPAQYRRLYQAMRDGFKAGDRHAQVGFGEVGPFAGADKWLHSALRGLHGVDYVSVHAYQDPSVPPTNYTNKPDTLGISALAYTHAVVASTHVKTKAGGVPPVDVTEMGYRTSADPALIGQAVQTANSYDARSFTLYQIFARPSAESAPAADAYGNPVASSSPGGTWDTSLIDPSGQPTAAYRSVQRAVARIHKAKR